MQLLIKKTCKTVRCIFDGNQMFSKKHVESAQQTLIVFIEK